MCGIAGIIDFRGRPIDRGTLEGFCRCLGHRGPDDSGTWIHHADGFSAGLAHTRLAVIDPTPEAHQPMIDPAGRYALTYNGELYNYRELRSELSDVSNLHTASDTEVVLRALAAWGPDALRRFDAMWALGFVDTGDRCGQISRDTFGIKPLYYVIHDDRLLFASELRALTNLPGLPLEIDPLAVGLYLSLGFIPHPYTVYRGVHKLPPGHVLTFDASGPKPPERYDRLGGLHIPESWRRTGGNTPPGDYASACTRLREIITTAVLRQRVSDVPLGAFLSGGLDSSIVVACLASAGGPAVKTFSIGYADHPRYDETRYARIVAEHFRTEHHEFRLTFADVLAAIQPVLDHLGEPFADSSLIPTSLVSRHTRKHVTVALSGDGGDELFGGYWRYLGHHYLARYQRLPAPLRRGLIEPLLAMLPAARSNRRLDRLRQFHKLLKAAAEPDVLSRHLAWARIVTPELLAGLADANLSSQATATLSQMYHSAPLSISPSLHLSLSQSPPLSRSPDLSDILLADLAIGLPADMLFKVDAASMMHSLEVRVPLLATDVVEYAAALPIEYKISGTQRKRILKDAFRGVLPDAILDRGKMGFEVPVGEFLRDELRDLFHSTVTPAALASLGLNAPAAARLYDDHLHRRADHTEILWALLVLCRWRSR